MNLCPLYLASVLSLLSVAQATETKDESRYGAKPLKGDYYMYGGTLSEMTPPTKKDRKLSLMFTGQLAKDLFNEIGPDVRKDQACNSDAEYRERRRGNLYCSYTREDGFSCTFGVNVITGKSTYGSIC